MKRAYSSFRFRGETLKLIDKADEIVEEYSAKGHSLTLRQLYYQFVARGLLANNERNYKRLGSIVNDGRLGGYLDWNAIEDRTRDIIERPHWDSPAQILESCARQYAIDKWQNQKRHVEVWIEKDALIGVIERVAAELDVICFSCRGYSSQSAMWRAAMRMRTYEQATKETVVLYLGDHDPSGINMTSDIRTRLMMFGARTEIDRIALTMDQIRELDPPPNPAKQTDSRFAEYTAKFGDECWELDALDPVYIEDLVRDKVYELRDADLWEEMVKQEKEERAKLRGLVDKLEE